jgi:hypothetical protein
MSDFPGFLTSAWFCADNAGLLRDHVKARVHRLMAEQAGDQGSEAVRELRAMAEAYDRRDQRWGSGFWGGRGWMEIGLVGKGWV